MCIYIYTYTEPPRLAGRPARTRTPPQAPESARLEKIINK